MPDEPLYENPGTESTLTYKIDGTNFSSYGVYVSASKGILDMPSMKEPQTVNWPGSHGTVVDLAAPRYNNREIELDCFIRASGKLDFFEKVRDFINAFQKPFLRTLELWIADKPLIYRVYPADSINIDKKWHEHEMFGTFTLKLIEPQPVKRLLVCTGTSVSIQFTTSNPIDIFWSDGSAAYGVIGAGVVKTKTFLTANTRYILLCGVIEEISNFAILSTNTQVVWSKY